MTIKSFLSSLLTLACVGSLLAPVAAADRKPNLVVIVADDLGYADVLFNPQHQSEVTTPHLDALARESIICRQGYVSGHVCSPTRAGLMTGRHQQRLGLYTGGEAGSGLPMSETLFPQFLKPAGYTTCQLGKWHLGPDPEWSPALRGFDEVFGFLGRGAHDYFRLNDPEDPIYRGTTPVQESGYLTDRLGEEAVSFVERHKDEPFLLYLAFNAVHAPLQAPADEIAKFDTGNTDRNTLLAMGKRMDDAIGSVVATLKRAGVWEDTLLFFISDNGGPLAQSAVNTPLRGGKHQDYEGGIRVPFLVCWPGRLPPGESQAVVSSLDILPTCLAAAGVEAAADKPFDGINLLPILRGEAAAQPRNLFWCAGGEEGWWAVRSGDWKLVGEKGRIGLFDLGRDISEAQDLSRQMPEKVAELTALHDAWLAEMASPIKGGGKRYGLEPPVGKPKQNRKKQPADPTAATSTIPRSVTESFAALPTKPWKTSRGTWEARDRAIWGAQESGDKQQAKLTGPATFRSGELRCDLNLSAGSDAVLRLKDAAGDVLLRIGFTPESLSVTRMDAEPSTLLKRVSLKLTPGSWCTLTLKFDGPELVATVGDTTLIATDSIFEADKVDLDFLITGGPVGMRSFSLTPMVAHQVPQE